MNELSLHILDILGNSVRAGAGEVALSITESRAENIYRMVFRDNGKGMSPEMLADVFNPWVTSRKQRRVGLGLSLLKQSAELCGGDLVISSVANEGTTVCVEFEFAHLDRPVAGDIAGTLVITAASAPEIAFLYSHTTDTGHYQFSSVEVMDALDGVSLTNPSIMRAVEEMIRENLREIGAEGDVSAMLQLLRN
ncbi:histidine kinase [Desulfoluna limicola]|uniref:histidine kinase n=1 Tax=Desulfoluna limicola TaxID=2810562 RepID=A0ABN6F6W4_9BACT|nr:ATP-binding protein [Desulfoluna limicola]BCS97027.1 histidine kinase [Desulfoluna limicola]